MQSEFRRIGAEVELIRHLTRRQIEQMPHAAESSPFQGSALMPGTRAVVHSVSPWGEEFWVTLAFPFADPPFMLKVAGRELWNTFRVV